MNTPKNPDWDDDSDNALHKLPPMDWSSIGEIKVKRVLYSEYKPATIDGDTIRAIVPINK